MAHSPASPVTQPWSVGRGQGIWSAATIFARLALAAGFLSAVADRFGLWGDAGTSQVGWGNFEAFTQYVQTLAPYLPTALITVTAWGVTVVEILLGGTLLLGVKVRWAALGSAATLFVFAVSMFIFGGFETPLSASVFTAAAAALLLMLAPPASYTFSLDRLRGSRSSGTHDHDRGQQLL